MTSDLQPAQSPLSATPAARNTVKLGICGSVIALCGLAALSPLSSAEVTSADDSITVSLANGTTLGFALSGEHLLGLQTAQVGEQHVSARNTVQRPIIAQDFGSERLIIQSWRYREAQVEGDRVVLHLEAIAVPAAQHDGDVFVLQGQPDQVRASGMTPELERLHAAAEAARQALHDFAASLDDRQWNQRHQQFNEALEALAQHPTDDRSSHHYIRVTDNERRTRGRLLGRTNQLVREHLPSQPQLAEHQAAIAAWETALAEAAQNFPAIHRDYYKFPIWRQPAEVATLEAAQTASQADGTVVGSLRWVIEPTSKSVGGWQWQGWQQSFEFELDESLQVNHFATLGTWELGGSVVNTEVIALRYRGLGGLTQHFSDDGNGAAAEAFSTTEIIPGAAGGAPLVSPVVAGDGISGDRSHALQHRVGAWIAQPARGAGAPFIDVQHREGVLFAAIPARQGNLRAVTEVMPGDTVLSQTDLEYFALTNSHHTIPISYVVLVDETPFPTHEIRTRYGELDQHVRNVVSEELGFLQHEVLPGVHFMIDHNFSGQIPAMANSIPALAEQGVRRIETHQPGWQNGREREPGQAHIGGGVCDIYDYRSLSQARNGWQEATRLGAKHGIAHYAWLTGMVRIDGPLHQDIGSDVELWAFNAPNPQSLADDSTGYRGNSNKNIHHPRTRQMILDRLEESFEDVGFQGFWADSFQNLFMSQLDWAQGTGDSLQRKWWEVIAAWSQRGWSWTAESHSFPGQSCSIEVQGGWNPDNMFLATHVNRAFRANTFPNAGSEQADELAFWFMANKGWAAPDLRTGQLPDRIVPGFARLAKEYSAALPTMRRSFQLPGNAGVLWLSYADNANGVIFPFRDAALPNGVQAQAILSGEASDSLSAIHTYRVQGENLIAAFGMRQSPQADERIGREYQAPGYAFPSWATEEQ